MHRSSAVAGYFYKGSPDALKKQVEGFVNPAIPRKKATGILSPHAGLIYSGSVAGAVYSGIELPDTFVLIGPNHTGLGAPVSIMARGSWETPLGTVAIDERLAASIMSKSPLIHEDTLAHLREHSLEVQLPFIQYFKPDFRIVPIQMLDTRLEACLEVGRAVGEAIAECTLHSRGALVNAGINGMRNAECTPKNEAESRDTESAIRNPKSELSGVLIVASSDMSHYEQAAAAKEKDFRAIRHILNLDPKGLYREVKGSGITMCGFGPAVAMLVASKLLGATKAELIKYTNSGEVSGDYEQVVGYAGIVVR